MDYKENQPVIISIAGVDPSGGAGTLADIKTFAAFGCYGAAVITSLTFQNTVGVYGSANQTGEVVRRQLQPVIDDLKIAGIKTGMLPSADVIEEVAKAIKEHDLPAPVVDPVVRSTSGFDLIDDEALSALVTLLFPLAEIVTPNLAETERITKMAIANERDIETAARKMQELGAANVLIKGGHFQGATAKDFLFEGEKMTVLSEPWVESKATHGTGCTLASAIAANLALGKELAESVKIAKAFVTEGIRSSPMLGHGHPSLNHLIRPKS